MSSKLLDDLLADIKTAMKSRENDRLVALRTLHAQVKDATVNVGREATDADVATVVAKAIKQRQDSIEQFRAGGRDDLAAKEQQEIEIYKKYQPAQLGQAEIEALVKNAIADTGAAGKKDLGKVMQALMPQVKGRADGKLVNQIVQAQLGN
ncbi:MAG: GatB/YqeY domain-containing protein [bacterium]